MFRRTSTKARPFGLRLMAYDPFVDELEIAGKGVEPASLPEVLAQSDFISMHMPATPQAQGFLKEQHFRQMKKTAIFINTGRGPTVDEAALALIDAPEDGQGEPWTPARLKAAREAHRAEHFGLRLDPEARNLRHTTVAVAEDKASWQVEQMLIDAAGLNDWMAAMKARDRNKARDMAYRFGNQLIKESYRGYFDLDFLIDEKDGEVYLGELNPRICGASSITNHSAFAYADAPLFLFHLMEFSGLKYKIDVEELNARWAQKEFIDSWSQLVIKSTSENVDIVTNAPPTGVYKMAIDGTVSYDRFDYDRQAIESEREAFFLVLADDWLGQLAPRAPAVSRLPLQGMAGDLRRRPVRRQGERGKDRHKRQDGGPPFQRTHFLIIAETISPSPAACQ